MKLPESWPRCPRADAFFAGQMCAFAAANPLVEQMASRFHQQAGVNILNLVDHWLLPASAETAGELQACGLTETHRNDGIDDETVWEHPQARFPLVRLSAAQKLPRLALAVEDVTLFLETWQLQPHTQAGMRDAAYEEAVCASNAGELAIAARRGYKGFRPHEMSAEEREALFWTRAAFRNRRRDGEKNALKHATQITCSAILRLGFGRVADEFFASERVYYMNRCRAASWQYDQQQKLGFGWANHDHHTYRSSRQSFRALMQLFLSLGFETRERFYAGAEAGWGAQILEHPDSRVVIFADVDMAPRELDIHFASVALRAKRKLGTIGLWCGLHGSSIAQAGMHHLEAEFDFAQCSHNMEAAGYGVMAPFTDMPILRQAFTRPEIWPVAPERIQALLDSASITPEQAEKFRTQGAPGSHLEILQRWEGFKGFNKTGVSSIIRATDARNTDASPQRRRDAEGSQRGVEGE